MNKNQMKSKERRSDKLNVENLKRPAIHPVKSLYPMDELENVEFEESSVENGSPLKNLSETESDSSPKTEVKYRGLKKSDSECSSPKTKEEPQIKANSNDWKLRIYLIIIAIMTFAGMFVYKCMYSSPVNKSLDVENLMSNMRHSFTGQPDITFRIVKTAIKRTVSGKSLAPGIIILLASKEAKDISHKFALHLAESISYPSDYVSVKSNSFRTPEELKKDIDDTIQSNLTDDTLKVVLVDGIDLIPFEAAMIFHSYCDHENALFKNVIYVMTMSSDERITPNSEIKTWDSLALKRLKDVWKDSGEDQVNSLISRLTVAVAAIIGKT